MHISRIFVYPVKSLRPYEPSFAAVTKSGFAYDRRFMILQVQEDGSLKNMHVAYFPELVLMFAEISFPDEDQNPENAKITITWRPQSDSKTMDVPLIPDVTGLEKIEVNMHKSPTSAYKMHEQYNEWLSSCLGYKVVLAYLGENMRSVLMSTHNNKVQTTNQGGWLSGITNKLPTSIGTLISGESESITFADCAPFLVVSETSLKDVSNRLPDGEEMDITKFRPNIIITGAEKEWEEDYWSEIEAGDAIKLHLVHNCVRCQSLNIDYTTGKPGTGESGKILKKLQSNRRVDAGAKYSPVFGRYSFLSPSSEGKILSLGDKVNVVKRNDEHTKFDWPGLS